jgi:hypothetical protein
VKSLWQFWRWVGLSACRRVVMAVGEASLEIAGWCISAGIKLSDRLDELDRQIDLDQPRGGDGV